MYKILFVREQLALFPNKVSKKPFLKWAGGKTQLIPTLLEFIPPYFNKYLKYDGCCRTKY